MSNYISENINEKKVRTLAGKTTCKIGRWRTNWRDLSISNIYSIQPYPIKLRNMLKTNTAIIKACINPPEVFNESVWELIGNYFLTSWVRFQQEMSKFLLYFCDAKRY